jgi:GTP-binding protein
MILVDKAVIMASSGNGGNGSISFRHEMFVPKGGPDGGDGGKGGSVFLEVDPNLVTLRDFRYNRHFKAAHGANGAHKQMSGLGGKDCVIKVPPGTLVYDDHSGGLLADLIVPQAKHEILKGGKGGKGNARFASSTRQTPRIAEQGEPGKSITLRLELKLLADIGLIGFPNAGKSSLLSALTQAQPKIANYPFTTLSPNLGVMKLDEYATCTIADMPGLIEGAHEGKGLGTQFLRHIERTKVLVYVIDVMVPDPGKEYDVLRDELREFNPALLKKPQLVVYNKIDLLRTKPRKSAKILHTSAKQGDGLDAMRNKLAQLLKKAG